MPIMITMPALSPTMEEGRLAKWLKSEGDKIEAGDVIAEIETDKAMMEVEAIDEGTLTKIVIPAGTEGVKVNSVIAVLTEEGEAPGDVAADISAQQEAATGPEAATPISDSVKRAEPVSGSPVKAESLPQGSSGASLAAVPAAAPLAQTDNRIKASPLARRIASLKKVDLSRLHGSGPNGRIVKKDVEAAARTGLDGPSPAVSGTPDSLLLPQTLDERIYAPDSYRLEPLDGMRRTVARRLAQSFMQVPHFPLNVDIALDRLLAARAAMNAAAPEGVKISVNDILIKASALALMAEPDCNASYTDKGIAYHKSANVSVAVAIEGGLITPVIFKAETKSLSVISAETKALAQRARARKLKPEEYSGGTFSISNLGMFGVKSFASIINPPEGMILSVGAGEKRPVIGADGTLGTGMVMSVTLTCDHRVVGGAEGARWLAAFKRHVETPESMLL